MLGATTAEKQIKLTIGNEVVLEAPMTDLRDTWEATSFALEMMQRTPEVGNRNFTRQIHDFSTTNQTRR